MKTTVLTQQEIWSATKPQVIKSRKAYTRKNKHKKDLDK